MSGTQPASTAASRQARIQSHFELGVACILSFWPALSVAVDNQWGGPDSADKRDWLAGAITEMFTDRSDTDQGDIEAMLQQAMFDEFEVRLEDDSDVFVAEQIMTVREETLTGNFARVTELHRHWLEREGRRTSTRGTIKVVEPDQDVEDGDGDEDFEDGDGDTSMEGHDSQATVTSKPRAPPEIDEDGFTKVTGRRR